MGFTTVKDKATPSAAEDTARKAAELEEEQGSLRIDAEIKDYEKAAGAYEAETLTA